MAVPKRKTSVSKRNMRRSHLSAKPINIILDKESGEPRLSHQIVNPLECTKEDKSYQKKTIKIINTNV